jgi:hypothetical protein
MPDHQGGETFVVELLALRDSVPPHVRLRMWLKSALRAARFRALRVSATTPELPPLTAVEPVAEPCLPCCKATAAGCRPCGPV